MTELEELSARSASAIGRGLAAGEASPVALAKHYLAKIEASNAKNVFLCITKERALAEAQASEKRLAKGRPLSALDGVPIAIKDLVDLSGEVTTAGSNHFRNAPPAKNDAVIAENLSAAGMVTLGKTNLTEFAYSGLGLNPHFGTPHNPLSSECPRIPGGSSSGSGVAVAAGFAPCAIGSDTGGSVRIPSSFNGLVGYKSSEGRISTQGVFALSQTHDTIGPLARSVEDCLLLDMALRGAPTSAVTRRSLTDLTLFVPETIVLEDLEPAVSANFQTSLDALENAGAKISRGPFELFSKISEITRSFGTIVAAEAYTNHLALMTGPDYGNIDPRVAARIMAGAKMSAADLITLQQTRANLLAEFRQTIGDALMVMPTTAMTAPELGPLEADDDHYHKTNLKALRNTLMGNYLNMPGLAIPNGVNGAGMPTSFLINAPGGDDERLFGFGLEIERVLSNVE